MAYNPTLFSILPILVGGLIFFLFAIRSLSQTLQDAFSEQVKRHIKRYTKNIYLSIFLGIIATIALDSSSAVIIITIVFINAGSLNFKNTMGIIMGANIGTTASSQIIALNISKYAYIPMVIGFLLWFLAKGTKLKRNGKILLYFGMLFYGLFLLENSVEPLKESGLFTDWMLAINDPLTGAATGGLVTLIIQSSSATVGMLITLAKQKLIELPAALAAMLGAELGTCSDTLLAVIGGTRDAIRAGIFHLLFNLFPIGIGLLFFDQFTSLVRWLSSDNIAGQIANGHVLFSVLSVLLFLPFVNSMYKFVNYIIPKRVNKS